MRVTPEGWFGLIVVILILAIVVNRFGFPARIRVLVGVIGRGFSWSAVETCLVVGEINWLGLVIGTFFLVPWDGFLRYLRLLLLVVCIVFSLVKDGMVVGNLSVVVGDGRTVEYGMTLLEVFTREAVVPGEMLL